MKRRAPGQVFLAGMLLALAAQAQTEEIRTLAREDGTSVTYTLRTHPPDAHLLRPDTKPVPTSALDSAKLIYLHLSDGDIEQAALLSNSPRRRYEELRNFRERFGESEFKRVSWDFALGRIARLMKDDRDKNFLQKSGDVTVNRWTSVAFLAASASSNESGYITNKVIRSMGMTALDNQARV